MFRIFVPSVPVSNGLHIALIEPMDMRSIGKGVFRNALLICSRSSSCHVSHTASKSIWSRRVQASENLYTCTYLQIVCDLTIHCLLETFHLLIFTEMLQWSEFPIGGTVRNEKTTMRKLGEENQRDQGVKPGVKIMLWPIKIDVKIA